MTPTEALTILEQATATIQATRDEHQLLVQALQVLNQKVREPSSNGVKSKAEKIIEKT